MDGKDVVTLLGLDEVADYVNQRRLKLVGSRHQDLAAALGVSRTQIYDLLAGRETFGKVQIERLNAIDPVFELVQAVAVVRRTRKELSDVGI